MSERPLSTRRANPVPLPPGLVHDLRAPLNLIIGYSEMLLEQAQEQGRNDFLPDLRQTRTAGLQMLRVIDANVSLLSAWESLDGVTLPELEAEEASDAALVLDPPEAAERRFVGTRGSLLVVDDMQASRDLIARRLRRLGYAVATAESGQRALEMARATPFDLVLLDITMPGMDGYEVLEHLKTDEALRRIPVIMISALSGLDSVVRCMEMGAADYLGKPFNSTLLRTRIGSCLEKNRVEQSERELAAARALLDTSRLAGMAEVATSILHNVGNVLNSVNVSGGLILEKIHRSKVTGLSKAVALIETHKGDLAGFFDHDPKGKQLFAYLAKLEVTLTQEREALLQEVHALLNNITHIKAIVAMQQDHARVSGVTEMLALAELVDAAIRLNGGALDRHRIRLVREYPEMPPILLDKHKVLQILVNLIRNAKRALDDSTRDDKQVTLRITHGRDRLQVSVIDNGIGIPPENLTRIFGHGFTTKKEGHGFGLHGGALAARELGGTLTAFSEGAGRGSRFTLELPLVVTNDAG